MTDCKEAVNMKAKSVLTYIRGITKPAYVYPGNVKAVIDIPKTKTVKR
jgi:hypothetical protein